MDKIQKYQIGDTPLYISKLEIISILKNEFLDRINRKTPSFNETHKIKTDSHPEWELVWYEDDFYGNSQTARYITDDPYIIELYDAIMLLDKNL